MRAKQFTEAALGTNPKRPRREGSRHERGHEPQKRYVTVPWNEVVEAILYDQFSTLMKRYDLTFDDVEHIVRRHGYNSTDDVRAEFGQDMAEGVLEESKTVKQDANKPRNFVAKNAINTGAGAHKDKKKAEKQGDFKHKKQAIPMDEVMQDLEAAFKEEKAPRALCISSKPDEDLGASQLASCKSQGLRARDGNKSHKLGKSPKSRVKVGGKRIKGNKYGGPLPDWS